MKLKFEQVDDEHINIICYGKGIKEHKVGTIQTPSGSGECYHNAIQVCGFSEAFDLWGCACFKEPLLSRRNRDSEIDAVVTAINFMKNDNGEMKMQHAKDIQLLFSAETIENKGDYRIENCGYCYNIPCTCETRVKYENPYTVKRSQDLFLETRKDEDDVKEIVDELKEEVKK